MTETFDELKDKLLDKVEKELTEYEAELLIKSPKDILDGAYKYHICYDILTEIENMNEYEISKEKIGALLSTDNALDRIYTHWGNTETSYMDEIRDTICDAAYEIMTENSKNTQARADSGAR